MKVKLLTSVSIIYNGDHIFVPQGSVGEVLEVRSAVRVRFTGAFRGKSPNASVEIDVDAANLEVAR